MNRWIAITNINPSKRLRIENLAGNEVISKDDITVYYKLDGRFERDSTVWRNERYLIIIDGVILNLRELMEKYNTSDILATALEMYKNNGETFFSEFRGPFCGYFYDADKNKTMCFVNQTGDTAIFSYINEDVWIASPDFNCIASFLKENSINYTFNQLAAKYILTFGYMIDNSTFIKEIKRVTAGDYLISDGIKINERSYHKFQNKNIRISFEEAIEVIDKSFRKAIKRCFEKDLEYGYKNHLVDMSGGLDTRMDNWAAKDMGYNKIFNISYSQSNSDEDKIAALVSAYLNNEFMHKNLDDISFIYEIDEIIKQNYGLSLYAGITGGKQLLESLNYNKFGLEHTGQFGEVAIGSSLKTTRHEKPRNTYHRYSDLLSINFDNKILEKYENQELFALYTRGFLGTLSTHLIRRNYTYAVSPFIDVDFMSLCLSIPLKYRVNHKLYWAWVDKKYSDAGKIVSTRKRENINWTSKIKALPKRAVRKTQRECLKVFGKFHITDHTISANNMNPFEYWYETNADLRSFISKYYDMNISRLNNYDEIKNYVNIMYCSKNPMEKLMALSVIGTYKAYFGD